MSTKQREANAFFRVRFPDNGAGSTHYQGYIEGTAEEDVRRRAADHPRLNVYDASKGSVVRTGITPDSMEDLREKVSKIANPNDVIRADGTVLLLDRDAGMFYSVGNGNS